MADVDEYDFLGKEQQQPEQQQQANGSAEPDRGKDRKESDGDKDRDRHKGDRKDRRHSKERDRDDRGRRHKRSSRSVSRDRHRSHRDRERRDDRSHRDPGRGRERRPDFGRPEVDFKRPRRDEQAFARPPPPRREQTPPEIRAAREREKELAELDRDIRTVFAYNLNLKAGEFDLFEFFSQAGEVNDVKLITDRNTRKSKGFAYIEYKRREDIVNALGLTGKELMGQSVMVKSSEAEKNLAWEAAQAQAQAQAQLNAMTATQGTGPCKLLVANINIGFAEEDLRGLFAPFGPISNVEISRDHAGQSSGYGYVEFVSMADAAKGMQHWDGAEVVGQKLSVKIAQVPQAQPAPGMLPQIDLDEREDDYGGLKLTGSARAALMSRLAGEAPAPTGTAFAPPGMQLPGAPPLAAAPREPGIVWQNPNIQLEQGMLGPKSPIPTQCLLLKNMFDPAQETEPNWDYEIGNDVRDECEKFGQVVHHHVDKNSKGFVYLKFSSVAACQAAQKALNGRWFAGRQIAADFQFPAVYNNHFGL